MFEASASSSDPSVSNSEPSACNEIVVAVNQEEKAEKMIQFTQQSRLHEGLNIFASFEVQFFFNCPNIIDCSFKFCMQI